MKLPYLQAIASACIAVSLSACKDESRDGYVALAGRIFVFNPRVNSATYVVSLAKLKPIPDGATLHAEFDNPAGGARIVVDQKIWPQQEKIALESPNLTCIRKGTAYAFSVTLKDAQGAALQTIESSITSTLDQSVMPDAPLVVGPSYDPNPELQGDPGGKIPGRKKPDCPVPT
jgi:hypothetical protein